MENKKVKFFYKYKLEEKSSLLAVLLILIYFFYGFFSNEISAGAGGYDGDFKLIWSNLQILREGIILNLDNPNYSDSRPPLSYILHILVNPFISSPFFVAPINLISKEMVTHVVLSLALCAAVPDPASMIEQI